MSDVAVRTVGAVGPGVFALLSPDWPVLIGVASCVLVRLPMMRFKTIVPDLCMLCLASMGAAVTIHEHSIQAGNAFWCGIGFGAMGSTLIEIGKGLLTSDVRTKWREVGKIIFSIKGDSPPQ